ncbi:MAG: hypothetical protein M1587_02335 [Thaumarchaeota archaeon]|nr:hypothetical protein [Nitrososphaerota archaeon]
MRDFKYYLKYYWLEDYLFNEVSKSFRRRRYLKNEEFFAVVIWKSQRQKTNILRGIQSSGCTIKSLTSHIRKAKTAKEKIEVLTAIRGIGLSVASAVLTVCYPRAFTVVDHRARTSLERLGISIKGDPSNNIKAYFEYIDICKNLSNQNKMSLRNFDRALWAMDFYDGSDGLEELAGRMARKSRSTT